MGHGGSHSSCCLLGVCCPPGGRAQRKTLADIISDAPDADAAAGSLLAKFDFVPKGLGESIVAAYRAAFSESAASGTAAVEDEG